MSEAFTASLVSADGIERTSDWFRWRLVSEAWKAGLDADCIATALSIESKFKAGAVNPASGAAGIMQVMPQYAGPWGGVDGILSMSAESQLDAIVLPHFRRFPALRDNNDAGSYYLTIFLPRFYAAPDGEVLGVYQSEEVTYKLKRGALYAQNWGFDAGASCERHGKEWRNTVCSGGKGFFTVGDVRELARRKLAEFSKRPRIDVDLSREPERPDTDDGGSVAFGLGALVLLAGAAFAARRKGSAS